MRIEVIILGGEVSKTRLTLTRMSDDKYHCRYKLTSKQKKIFKAMNIDENHYYDRALDIAKNESILK